MKPSARAPKTLTVNAGKKYLLLTSSVTHGLTTYADAYTINKMIGVTIRSRSSKVVNHQASSLVSNTAQKLTCCKPLDK